MKATIWLVLFGACRNDPPTPTPPPPAVALPIAVVDHEPTPPPPPQRPPGSVAPGTVIAHVDQVGAMAAEGGDVYYVHDSSVFHVAATGGEVTDLRIGGSPQVIAIDRDALYLGDTTVVRWPRRGGRATTLAASSAIAIAVDSTSVYWVDRDALFRVAKTGGATLKLAQFDAEALPQIAVDGGFVDVALRRRLDENRRLVRVPIASGPPVVAATAKIIDNGDAILVPRVLAAGGGVIAYATDFSDPTTGTIEMIRGGAEPETLALPTMGTGVAVLGGRVYWTDFGGLFTRANAHTRTVRLYLVPPPDHYPASGRISELRAVDGERAYVIIDGVGLVAVSVAVPGPDPEILGQIRAPGQLAGDADGIVAIEQFRSMQVVGPQRVVALSAAGTQHVLESTDLSVDAVAVAGADAYWLDGSSVMTATRDGGPARELAAAHDGAAIAVDDTHVYWTQARGDRTELRRVPRDGGVAERLAVAAGRPMMTLARGGDALYWFGCVGATCTLYRRAPTGAVVELAHLRGTPGGLAADATGAYYTDPAGRAVWRAGAAAPLVRDLVSPGPIAICGDAIVWGDRGADTFAIEALAKGGASVGLHRVARDGSSASLIASAFDLPGLDPMALLCDAGRVTWLDADGGLARTPI